MGSNNGKQVSEKENSKRRSSFKRILRLSSRQTNNSKQRPISYAGINQYYEEHQRSTRPMSMIDVGPLESFKTGKNINCLENHSFFFYLKKYLLITLIFFQLKLI